MRLAARGNSPLRFVRRAAAAWLLLVATGCASADEFKTPGISGNAERETKVLAGVVHGYFTGGTYSDRTVPFDHLLDGFANDVALPDLMRNTKYRHAGSTILVNRQRNIDEALALI